MRQVILVLFLSITCLTCVNPSNTQTLEQIKAGQKCVVYREGLPWKDVTDNFGQADIYVKPSPGEDLLQNKRIYKNLSVVLYVDKQKINRDGKVEYIEVVKKIELCRE